MMREIADQDCEAGSSVSASSDWIKSCCEGGALTEAPPLSSRRSGKREAHVVEEKERRFDRERGDDMRKKASMTTVVEYQ